MRIERSFVERIPRNPLFSAAGRFMDRLLRGFLAVKIGIKLRLPLFSILLLAGCGVKNEVCYENENISFREIAADRCPDDPTFLPRLRALNPGADNPKGVDQQNFGILSDLMSGVCVLEPPCQVRIPAPETRPEPIILPPPPAPEPRDVAEEVREQRDVYEAPADAGTEIADAAPAPDALTIPPTLPDAATATEDAARRRDARQRENGGGRDNGTTLSDAGRPDRSFGVGGP